jgi:hypothetical protein
MNIILFILMIIHAVWIIGFQTFGLFVLPKKLYYMYPLACALVSLHWVIFDNKCILSVLENRVSEDKNSNDDTFVYDAIRDKLGVPIYTQKKFQHTMMTASFMYVAYIYRKDPKILALCLACLYLNRWEVWSKNFL